MTDPRTIRRREIRAYEARREQIAQRFGISSEDVQDLIEALPYSCIPDTHDAEEVLEWFIEHPEVIDALRDAR